MIDQEVPQEDLLSTAPTNSEAVPQEDLPQHAEVPSEDLPTNYSSPIEKVKTAGEGLAQGIAGPFATGFETHVMGVDPKDILARQQANPYTSGVSKVIGNVATMAAAPEIKVLSWGARGSKAINSSLQMMAIAAGDEKTKDMLGVGDPSDAVAKHIAWAGATGLLAGGLFGAAGSPASRVATSTKDSELSTIANSMSKGAAHAEMFPEVGVVSLKNSALTPEESFGLNDKWFQHGQKLLKSSGDMAKEASDRAIDLASYKATGPMGYVVSPWVKKILNPVTSRVSNYSRTAMGAILKAIGSGETENLSQVVNHAQTVAKGSDKILASIGNLFNSTSNKAIDLAVNPIDRDKLKKKLEDGKFQEEMQNGTNQIGQGFAKGGEVNQSQSPNAVAKVYPEQNMMLSAAKARVYSYLNAARPLPPVGKALFDTDHKDPNKERKYDHLIDLANQPLGVLNDIKKGSLTPGKLQDFKSMFPELHSHLSKKLTETMMGHKLDEKKKPSYAMRQALSLFLGNNLDSSLHQPNIAAAQNVFLQQNAAKQQQAMANKLSAKKIGEQTMTPNQSREKRLNKD